MNRPFMVGIQGGTCAGKTTLANTLVSALGEAECVAIGLDLFFHPFDRMAHANDPLAHNFDDPMATDWPDVKDVLRTLRQQKASLVPRFNYVTGLREASGSLVEPHPLIIVEGLCPLFDPDVRSELDFTVFLAVPPDILLIRRLLRDVVDGNRGWTLKDALLYHLHFTRPTHFQCVAPGEMMADLVLDGQQSPVALARSVVRALSCRTGLEHLRETAHLGPDR